jgi:hypothetical protein
VAVLQLRQGHSLRRYDAFSSTVRKDSVLPVQEQTKRSGCSYASGKLRGTNPQASRPAVPSVEARCCFDWNLRCPSGRPRRRVLLGGQHSLFHGHAFPQPRPSFCFSRTVHANLSTDIGGKILDCARFPRAETDSDTIGALMVQMVLARCLGTTAPKCDTPMMKMPQNSCR